MKASPAPSTLNTSTANPRPTIPSSRLAGMASGKATQPFGPRLHTIRAGVRARIARTDDSPAPGSSVRVAVATGAAQPAVAIPASALRKGPSGDHVFVLAEDKDGHTRVQQRSVEVAALLGDEVLIRSGLDPTERVAASGSFKLRDAMLVAVRDAPAPQARLFAGK